LPDQKGLVLRCDAECIIAIDGKVVALMEPDQDSLFPLPTGKHTLTAVSSSADDIWEGPIDFTGLENAKVAVSLLKARADRLSLESATAALREQVTEKQRQLKNMSTMQFAVLYVPGGLKLGKKATFRVSGWGVDLSFPNGEADAVACSDIVAVNRDKATMILNPLFRNEFVVRTKKRQLKIAIAPPPTWASLVTVPKAVNLIIQQVQLACGL
jgi:hypothetical protein